MLSGLSGKLALVAGAGSGIGKTVALKLAAHNCKVGLFDLNEEGLEKTKSEISSTGGSCESFVGDISKREHVQCAVDNASSHFDTTPTIGINCAGITRDAMLLKMTDEQWDSIMSCHLTGTFLFTQILARQMVKAKAHGSIVNTGSISGKIGNTGQANYSAAKAGIIAFSKTTARELGPKGIRCNTIVPGFINTPMAEAIPPHIKQMVIMMTPMGRFGETAEIADLYCFLASENSTFITGVDIEVAGGLAM